MAHPVGNAAAALGTLAREAERVQQDAASLYAAAEDGEDIPSLTLTVDVRLAGPQGRARFARALAEAVEDVVRRCQSPETGEPYRLSLIGYPKRQQGEERT